MLQETERACRPGQAEKPCMTSYPHATQEGYVYPLPLPLWLYLEFNMRESVNLLPLLSDTSHRWTHTPVTNPVPHVQAWHALRAYPLLKIFFFLLLPSKFRSNYSVTESSFVWSNTFCMQRTLIARSLLRSTFSEASFRSRSLNNATTFHLIYNFIKSCLMKLQLHKTCGAATIFSSRLKDSRLSCDCRSLEFSHLMIQHKATGCFSACSHMQACE